MPLYEVAGVVMDIANDASESFMYMREFILPQQTQRFDTDLNFIFQTKEFIEVPQGNIISEENISFKWLEKTSRQSGYYIYVQEFGIGKIMVLMDIETNWRKVVITWCDYSDNDLQVKLNSQSQIWLGTHIMMGIVFRYNLLQMDGLVIHASAIKWNGKGIIFSAPSGTGKSTHVKLWQEYIADVKVLNDDNPAIRVIDDQPFVFGTPWSGSAFIHSNDSAPLAAIVLLEQAEDNVLSRLDGHQVILKLMPRVFLPYFDQDLMHKAIKVLEKIITSVPVYLLQCRPDREAVELVHQCLK